MTSISFLSPIAFDQASAAFARDRVASALAGFTSKGAHPPSPASQEVHQSTVKAAEAAADAADEKLRADQAKTTPRLSTHA